MANHSQQIVQKLWSYCNVLRDDGLSYGDYVEQLTFLLFLKMAHERTLPPWSQPSAVPAGYDWPSLLARDGDSLEIHYRRLLDELGKKVGMLGVIWSSSRRFRRIWPPPRPSPAERERAPDPSDAWKSFVFIALAFHWRSRVTCG